MSDPIENLHRLGDAMEGAPMPLPASEIRARGERIRRRNHALVAGASAAAVAAVAVPVVALSTGDGSPDRIDPAPSPDATTLSEANLLTSDDAVYPNGGADWREESTSPGDGQAPAGPCQRSSIAGLGAQSVFQRDFEFVTTETGEVDPTLWFNEIIGEFESDQAAEAAYQEIRGWYDDCLPAGADDFSPGEWTPVPVEGGEAEQMLATYGPVAAELDPFGEQSYYLDTGLVLTGDRVAVLTQVVPGQDYNFSKTPIEVMLPAATGRLADTGAPESETASPDPDPSGQWPTEIPDAFPLTDGMTEDDGSDESQFEPPSMDTEAMVPAGELSACDLSPDDGGPVDRLTTRLTYPSSGHVREIQLFADDGAAASFADDVQDVFSGCPTTGEQPTITTTVRSGDLGEESWVIQRAGEQIYRTVILVVRDGNAVLVDYLYDEGDVTGIESLTADAHDAVTEVVTAMAGLRGDGTGDPDLSGPAATTEIPHGFPLDVRLDEGVEGATQVSGPDAFENGVFSTTICDEDAAVLSRLDGNRLGYSEVYEGEGHHGRAIRAYPTVQDAVDEVERLRAQLAGCERDVPFESTANRVWRPYPAATDWEDLTFGFTYEGQASGGLYTVVRVGNAILTLSSSGELSTADLRATIPGHAALVEALAPEMCVFTADGC